jgi:Na+/H+-dicarboxylate symporter
VGSFFLALFILWAVLIAAGFLVLGPRVFKLIWDVRAPGLIAFATASSEAAYPRLLEQLERHGIANRVVSFVLPLGYSFNLDGSMMYCTFAVMFIAQAMGIHLDIGQQIGMLLLLMVTSKGIAGVPRASLVVISATLPAMGMKPGMDRAGARGRRLHGHGPHCNKCDRQLDRFRRHREMGRPAVRSDERYASG